MGRGRDHRLFAERPVAAPWTRLQCDQREGARRRQIRAASKGVLGLGADTLSEREWTFPIHAADESPLRTEGILTDARRRRIGQRLRTAQASQRSDTACGPSL